MAAISSVSNGEAMSSVRTKLNSVITEVNLLDPTDWIDYSATSTVVGWLTTNTKIIKYRVIGKQFFVNFRIAGTSNNTATTFTLPYNCISPTLTWTYGVNNGSSNALSYCTMSINSNIVTFSFNDNATWVASGVKAVYGQFFYEIA